MKSNRIRSITIATLCALMLLTSCATAFAEGASNSNNTEQEAIIGEQRNNSNTPSDQHDDTVKRDSNGRVSQLSTTAHNPYNGQIRLNIDIGSEFADFKGSDFTEGIRLKVSPGGVVTLPKVKARDGYYFVGWCQGGVPEEPTWDTTVEQVTMGTDTSNGKNTTIYALYADDNGNGYCTCGAWTESIYLSKLDEIKKTAKEYNEKNFTSDSMLDFLDDIEIGNADNVQKAIILMIAVLLAIVIISIIIRIIVKAIQNRKMKNSNGNDELFDEINDVSNNHARRDSKHSNNTEHNVRKKRTRGNNVAHEQRNTMTDENNDTSNKPDIDDIDSVKDQQPRLTPETIAYYDNYAGKDDLMIGMEALGDLPEPERTNQFDAVGNENDVHHDHRLPDNDLHDDDDDNNGTNEDDSESNGNEVNIEPHDENDDSHEHAQKETDKHVSGIINDDIDDQLGNEQQHTKKPDKTRRRSFWKRSYRKAIKNNTDTTDAEQTVTKSNEDVIKDHASNDDETNKYAMNSTDENIDSTSQNSEQEIEGDISSIIDNDEQ